MSNRQIIFLAGGAFTLLLAVGVVALLVFDRREDARLRHLNDRLEREHARFRERMRIRPPLEGDPLPGTAWGHYRRAAGMLEDMVFSGEWAAAEEEINQRGCLDPDSIPGLREAMLAAEPYFDEVTAGTRTREVGWATDLLVLLEDERGFDPIDFVMTHLTLTRVAANVHAADGRVEEAVTKLRVLRRVGDDLARAGGLMRVLMCVTIRDVILDTLGDLAAEGHLPLESAEAWVRADRLDLPDRQETLDAEWLIGQAYLRSTARGELDGDPPGGLEKFAYRSAILHVWQCWRDLMDEVRRVHGTDGEAAWTGFHTALKADGEAQPNTPWGSMAGMLALGFDVYEESTARPKREAMLIGLALIRQRQKGAGEPLLEALPEGAIPLPFQADDWRLRRDPETDGWALYLADDLEDEDSKPLFRLRGPTK